MLNSFYEQAGKFLFHLSQSDLQHFLVDERTLLTFYAVSSNFSNFSCFIRSMIVWWCSTATGGKAPAARLGLIGKLAVMQEMATRCLVVPPVRSCLSTQLTQNCSFCNFFYSVIGQKLASSCAQVKPKSTSVYIGEFLQLLISMKSWRLTFSFMQETRGQSHCFSWWNPSFCFY